MFILELKGDLLRLGHLKPLTVFGSKESALSYVEKNVAYHFDIEDDQIVLYQVMKELNPDYTGELELRPVWECSGWHWEAPTTAMGGPIDGTLPGHKKPLYEERGVGEDE